MIRLMQPVLFVFFLTGVAGAVGAETRPNVIFILTDDQRWDAMSCMGHPLLKTPNMDRIRKEGTLFANAFVTTSLCSPSRASFLTGTYAHTHGVFGNRGDEFDAERTPSFPLLMQEAGYETGYVGKWHMGRSSAPRAGFDYWLSFSGQGVYENPPLNENGREFKAEGYMTDILTDYAVTFLEKTRGKPFCLYLSHKAVHGPFTPAQRHEDLFAEAKLPKPASFDDTFEGKPRWQRQAALRGWGGARRSGGRQELPDAIPPVPWDPQRKNQLNYYRALSAVDEGIGRVFDTLEKQGSLDDTAIIFAGDNGYFHGEHRRGDKRLMYEESLRIPLLMRYPPLVRPGSTVEEMVLNIDVAPTVLGLAGVEAPRGMQGRSVLPLLQEKDVAWREAFLYEYWVDLIPTIPRMVGVRTPEWKYVAYPDLQDMPELYHLPDDPHEMKNLAENPQHEQKRAELRDQLARLMRETGYRSPSSEKITSRGREPVLHLSFDRVEGQKALDSSGRGNHGQMVGLRIGPGKRGQAGCFDGQGMLRLENSASLDPAGTLWTVEAWIQAEADGVVAAHGGASRGYILFVEKGVPCFAFRNGSAATVVDGRQSCLNAWTHVAGVIDNRRLRLYVNGEEAGSRPFMQMLSQTPNNALTIGADSDSPVLDAISSKGFQGAIDEIKIHPRVLSPEEIREAAK